MKNFRKVMTVGAVVFAMGVTSAAGFAASIYKTPAEAVAGLTGKTVESVIAERKETNKTYGSIANDAGKLDEFKKESFQIKKDNLELQVKEGRITQERADTIIENIEENQEDCDGTGFKVLGENQDGRFGSKGLGQGQDGEGKPSEGRGQLEGKGIGRTDGERQGRNQGQGRGQGRMRLED